MAAFSAAGQESSFGSSEETATLVIDKGSLLSLSPLQGNFGLVGPPGGQESAEFRGTLLTCVCNAAMPTGRPSNSDVVSQGQL